MFTAQRFAIEVKGHLVRRGDFKPRRHAVHQVRGVVGIRQGSKQRGEQLFAGKNPQMQQTVVNQGLRAKLLTAAGLTTITDTNNQRVFRTS